MLESEYYVKNQTEKVSYNNDSGDLVLERLLDGSPCFAITDIETTEVLKEKKTIIINTWLDRHLTSSHITDLIREGFVIYQANGTELKRITKPDDLMLSPKVVLSAKELNKMLNAQKPKITHAKAFILDYYQCEAQERKKKNFVKTDSSSPLSLSWTDIFPQFSIDDIVLLMNKPQGINLIIDLHVHNLSNEQLKVLVSYNIIKKITLLDKAKADNAASTQIRQNNIALIKKWDNAARKKIALNDPASDLLDLIPLDACASSGKLNANIEALTIRSEEQIPQDSCPYLKRVSIKDLKATVKLDALLENLPNVQFLTLDKTTLTCDNAIALPDLLAIQLSNLSLSENTIFTLLSEKKKLQYLSFWCASPTSAPKMPLSFELTNLQTIYFNTCKVSAYFLETLLRQSQQLETLILDTTYIQGDFSKENFKLLNLKSLSLRNSGLTSYFVIRKLLYALPALTHLSIDITELNALRDTSMTIPSLTHIKLYNLDDPKFSILAFLTKQEKLQVLDLSELDFSKNEISPNMVKAIDELSSRIRIIFPSKISSTSYRFLSTITQDFNFVEELTIEPPISNEEFSALLAQCPNLKALTLHNKGLPDEAFESYKALKQLKTVSVVQQDKEDKQTTFLMEEANWVELLCSKKLDEISLNAHVKVSTFKKIMDQSIMISVYGSVVQGAKNNELATILDEYTKRSRFKQSITITSLTNEPANQVPNTELPPILSDGASHGPKFNPSPSNHSSSPDKNEPANQVPNTELPPILSDGPPPGPKFDPSTSNHSSSPDKNAWSMSMLIHQLNQFLLLQYPNDEQYLKLTEKFKEGICVAVSNFYAHTLMSSESLTEGIKKWGTILSTLRNWAGTALPDANSAEATYLNQLWSYVNNYYVLNERLPYQTLISSLDDLLALSPFPASAIRLGNYNHGCVLLFKEDTWVFFDPNYKNGQAQTYPKKDKEKLIETIHHSLGHALHARSDLSLSLPFNIEPSQVNHFFTEGGLFYLFRQKEYFEQYHPHVNLDTLLATAPECISFEDNSKPCWYHGIQQIYSRQFTLALLEKYYQLKSQECLERLERDIKKLKVEDANYLKDFIPDNHAIKTLFLSILKDPVTTTPAVPISEEKSDSSLQILNTPHLNDSNLTVVKIENVVASSALQICLEAHSFMPISEAQVKNNYFLRNTIGAPATPSNLSQFDTYVLSPEKHNKKNRLLKFTQQNELNNYLHHLQSLSEKTNQNLFVVNSFRDLKCAIRSPRLHDDNTCTVLPSPSGAFFDFLNTPQLKPNIIVVNWSNFSEKEVVQTNTLLDEIRIMDGVSVPEDTIILGLQNVSDPDAYRQGDFISRQVEIDVPETLLIPNVKWPTLEETSLEKTTCHEIVIDFYDDPNWQPYFYGQLIFDKNAIQFTPSPLLAALKNSAPSEETSLKIIFKNAPLHIPELNYAINSLISEKGLTYRGQLFNLPQQVHMATSKGYTLEATAESGKHQFTRTPFKEYDAVLNPTTLSRCFVQYRYNENTLTTLDGLIKTHTNSTLKLYLTRSLSSGMWARLLDEAKKSNCKLDISVAPNASLPDDLQSLLTPDVAPDNTIADSSASSAQLIISNDLRLSEKNLALDADNTRVVDLSELTKSDLFYQLIKKPHEKELVFDERISAIWSALSSGKTVVLKGKCSPELADELALLFRTDGGIFHNGEIEKFKGKLYVLTQEAELFHYINQQQTVRYTYTFEDKIKDFSLEFQQYAQQHAKDLNDFSYSQLEILSQKTPYLTEPKTLFDALSQLPNKASQPVERHAMDLSEKAANDFFGEREKALCDSLKKLNMVFLSGETGVGKSSFIQALKNKYPDKYQVSFGNIAEWASDNETSKEHWLFIDEANLENTQWSIFETLFSDPPQILHNGKRYTLTPQHKIIFAGNPANYGGERILPALFSDHPNVVTFNEMSHAYLFNELLKPILGNISETEDIARCFLRVFDYVKNVDKEAISARELKTMALLWKAKINENPTLDKIKLAHYCAYIIGRNTLKKDQQILLDSWFKTEFGSEPSIERSYPETLKDFHLTKSHYPTYDKLDDLMAMRAQPEKGGLCGLVLEGAPGNGKSHFVKAYLLSNGFSEIKLHTKEHTDLDINAIEKNNQHFYYLPATLSASAKRYYLRRAFHEGAVVVMDELNAGCMLERLVNSLLMGEDEDTSPAKNSGFLLLGTQNPSSMPGREETSLAIQRRVMHSEFPEYSALEIHQILCGFGFSQSKAYSVVAQFVYAKKINPELTFRELIRCAKALKNHQYHETNDIIQLPTALWQSLTILSQSSALQKSDEFVLQAINEIGFHNLVEYHEDTKSFHFKALLSDDKNLRIQSKALAEYTQEELRHVFYQILIKKNYTIPKEMPGYEDIIKKENDIATLQKELNETENAEIWFSKVKAFFENNPNDIHYLLNSIDLNKKLKDSRGQDTALLLLAASNKHEKLVDILMKHKADLSEINKQCWPSITGACQDENLTLVKVLVNNGVDINKVPEGQTPLMIACKKNNPELAKYLIDNRAKVGESTDDRNSAPKNSPLIFACEHGNWDIAKNLIAHEARVDENGEFYTPLTYCCKSGHLEFVKFLIEKGASVDKKDACKRSPISSVLQLTDLTIKKDLIELLIKNKAKTSLLEDIKIGKLYWGHLSPKDETAPTEKTAQSFFKPDIISSKNNTNDDELKIHGADLLSILNEYKETRNDGIWKGLGFEDGSKTIKNLRALLKDRSMTKPTLTLKEIREKIHRKDLTLTEKNATNYILGLISTKFTIKSHQRSNDTSDSNVNPVKK